MFFQVPGRLGLLITLDLIAANVYNSVQGPPSRGFSFVEVWMLGINISILVGVLEYGYLLATKKFRIDTTQIGKVMGITMKEKQNDVEFEVYYKKIDKITFLFTLIFIIVFNLIYWSIAIYYKTNQ